MKITGNTILLAIIVGVVLLVGIVSADSDYCDPTAGVDVSIDAQGTWQNITITSDDCMVWTSDEYGNITGTPCDNTAPASITNLNHTHPSCTEINWTWDNPVDADFNHTMIYWNDVNFFHNLSNTTTFDLWYGLFGDTEYTFSSTTCDVYGNCNATWVNQTLNTTSCAVAPIADFSVDNTTVCQYQNVTFTDLSTNTPTIWYWLFGDGSVSWLQNPSYNWSTVGLFNISLKAGNAAGDDTKEKVNYINVTDCTPPDTIEKLTHTEDCYNITWNWIDPTDADFDHVMIYQNETFLHNITVGVETDTWAGLSQNLSYNFSSRTVDTSGNVDTDWVNHTVSTDTCIFVPVVDFSGTPLDVCLYDNVTFTDISTNTPTAWLWNFGDGSAHSTLQNPIHQYNVVGLMDVSLKAGNSAGSNTTSKSNYVNVTDCTVPPGASFTSNVTCGIIPFAVNFTDTSTGGNITNWSWMFGDGNTSYSVNPENLYITAGLYTVNHSVTNSIGTSWSNVTNYITARFPGDTCEGNVTYAEQYDTDKYPGNWFTSWWM